MFSLLLGRFSEVLIPPFQKCFIFHSLPNTFLTVSLPALLDLFKLHWHGSLNTPGMLLSLGFCTTLSKIFSPLGAAVLTSLRFLLRCYLLSEAFLDHSTYPWEPSYLELQSTKSSQSSFLICFLLNIYHPLNCYRIYSHWFFLLPVSLARTQDPLGIFFPSVVLTSASLAPRIPGSKSMLHKYLLNE